jgi:drug/metabolite transporter (DMT)-like permease
MPLTPNQRGAAFMVASMAGFAIEDMFLKSAVPAVPLGEALALYGGLGLMAFILFTLLRGESPVPRTFLSPQILIRSGFEVTGRLFYALAFTLTPLTSATAILQATPLLVVAGAALVFGEKVSPGRWFAILLGFCGVLLILRPGLDGYAPLSLLAVVGMIGFAGRDLATRAAPPGLSTMQLGVIGFAMLTLVGAGLSLANGGIHWPNLQVAAVLAGATLSGVGGYYALTIAMRTGDVSAVTPFRYTRLVFALGFGASLFGERPDALMLLGSAIVVGSGVFALVGKK